MHEYAARQREYLGLVLQAAEGRREDQAVVVALKVGAGVAPLVVVLLHAEAFGGDEAVPVHLGRGIFGLHVSEFLSIICANVVKKRDKILRCGKKLSLFVIYRIKI